MAKAARLAEIGDNSINATKLGELVERIENLLHDRALIAEDLAKVYAEAKGAGFSPRILRELIRLRKKDADDLKQEIEAVRLYADALGMPSFI